jgi:uncharacterized Zn finger protein (UPF0148 family)
MTTKLGEEWKEHYIYCPYCGTPNTREMSTGRAECNICEKFFEFEGRYFFKSQTIDEEKQQDLQDFMYSFRSYMEEGTDA